MHLESNICKLIRDVRRYWRQMHGGIAFMGSESSCVNLHSLP